MKRTSVNTVDPVARLRVGIILAEHFTLSAFALFVDPLRLAADKDDQSRPILCQWKILGNQPAPVLSSCGAGIARNSGLSDPREFDYIAVIGGLLHGRRQVDEATLAYLRAASAAGVCLIGICTGVFVLCQAGLMEGRASCVSWYHRNDFSESFPQHEVISDRMFLIDGNRITCSGARGAADLSCHLIEEHLNSSLARKASHLLLLDRPERSNAVPLQPHPPLTDEIGHISDSRVRRTALEMEQHMANPLPIHEFSARLNLSVRQLERLFHDHLHMRPMTFYRLIRLRYAYHLLQQGQLTITEIALETGFADSAHFSRRFKSMFGMTPKAARNTPKAAGDIIGRIPGLATERTGVRLF